DGLPRGHAWQAIRAACRAESASDSAQLAERNLRVTVRRTSPEVRAAVSHYLAPVIAASADWLERTYTAASSPILSVWAGIQARQAATVAAWLRYPTVVDAALVAMAGPGGAGRLDALVAPVPAPAEPWRSWVDEVVVSWAACLLTDAEVA